MTVCGKHFVFRQKQHMVTVHYEVFNSNFCHNRLTLWQTVTSFISKAAFVCRMMRQVAALTWQGVHAKHAATEASIYSGPIGVSDCLGWSTSVHKLNRWGLPFFKRASATLQSGIVSTMRPSIHTFGSHDGHSGASLLSSTSTNATVAAAAAADGGVDQQCGISYARTLRWRIFRPHNAELFRILVLQRVVWIRRICTCR